MVVTTESELDAALAEMGVLNQLQHGLQAECNVEIESVKKRFQEMSFAILADGSRMPIPERLNQLETAITAFCAEKKAELIPDPKKKKSKLFTHGTIGWRAGKATIQDIPEAEAVRTGIVMKLINAVINCLAKITAAGIRGLTADRVFSVEIKLNRPAILKLVDDAQITPKQLEKLGVKYVEGEDKLWIQAAEVTVSPHAGAVA